MESAPSCSDDSPAEERSAQLFDFLLQLERDRAAGQVRELDVYQRRFPLIEAQIEEELELRKHSGLGATPASDNMVGPYRLMRELGRGGQGVVYLAEDTRIQREVALKLLPASALLFSEERRERLRREAEIVSRLDHPGICGIFDAEIGPDFAYIAMPVVEGRTLAVAMAEAREDPAAHSSQVAPKTSEELCQVLAFFEDCARALHAAHERGIVHRDIKAANLMVTPQERGVWLDFGQARDVVVASKSLTLSGEVFGTPAYMSPEQVAGAGERVDARTDVWALGVTLFEALTLQRPFEAAGVNALMNAIREDQPRSARALNPTVTRDVEVVLNTALEKDLSRRYASASELADELARIRRFEPILARPAGPWLRFSRWVRRSPAVFMVTSVAAVCLTIALGVTLNLLASEARALDYALGRHLGERSIALIEEDPSTSLILAIEAVERAPGYLTRSALYTALDHCYLARELDGEPARRFLDIDIAPGGSRVAAALSDGTGRLFELSSGAEVLRWQAHTGSALVIDCAGPWIVSGGEDGRLTVFDMQQERIASSFEGPGGLPKRLFVNAEGTAFDVETDSGAKARYSLPSCERVSGVVPSLESAEARLRRLCALFEVDWVPQSELIDAALSPDFKCLATVSDGGVVRIWDLRTGRMLSEFEGYLNPVEVAWSLDGEFVVTHSKGPTARVWFATNRPDLYTLPAGESPLVRARFSRDGERALTVSQDGTACLWATPSAPKRGSEIGVRLGTFELGSGEPLPEAFEPFATSLGRELPSVVRLASSLGDVTHEVTSPGGEHIACADTEGHLCLLRSDDGALVWERALVEQPVRIVDLTFDPQGRELAVACSDRRVRFLSTASGERTRDHLRVIPPRDVQWSPDGKYLLVTGRRGRAAFHVEHLETGARMRTEVFHHGDITSGSFSPDGALVLTSSMDGTIFVRDVSNGNPIAHLSGEGAPILAAAFSSGAGTLRVIGAFADGTARVWPVDALPAAKQRKPRDLAEWEHAREERLALPLRYR